MPISPSMIGATSPLWEIELTRDGGTFDLTNQQASWITLNFYSNVQTTPGSYTFLSTGTGTVTILSERPGIIQYKREATDTNTLTPGQYWIRAIVKMNGTDPDPGDYMPLFLGA